MARFVALLRGVNVGTIKVTSKELAAMARRIGLDEVRTVLASGNLLFSSDDAPSTLAPRIEGALRETFGYDAWIVLTTADHVADVVGAYPFDADREGHQDYAVFASDAAVLDEIVEATAALPDGDERTAPGDGVVYWQCPKGSTLKTPFAKLIAKARYRSTTTNRNLRTLRKLV
jgi:uncharacterized protein (DUF1697 family)